MRKPILTVCCLYIAQIAIIFWPGSTIKNLIVNSNGTDGESIMRIEQSQVKYVIDFARKKDFKRITLLTDKINEQSQDFFIRHGFIHSRMIPMRWISDECPAAS